MLRKLFGSGKKESAKSTTPIVAAPLHDINYPSLVIIAWTKAVEGNEDLQLWLRDNGYPELYMATFAVLLKDDGTFVEYKVPPQINNAILTMDLSNYIKRW